MDLRGYEKAQARYAPRSTRLLIIAEAPPNSIDRYFYYSDVSKGDWLWIALMKALFPNEWRETSTERARKDEWLRRFQNRNYRLIDGVKGPISGNSKQRMKRIEECAESLIKEIKEISPKQILLVKATVFAAIFDRLQEAGLPVVNEEALPFPSSGRQTEFACRFRHLVESGKLTL